MIAEIRQGAAYGVLLGGFLLAIGAVRYAIAAVLGTPVEGPDAGDLALLVPWFLAFAMGGALIAALKPLRSRRAGAAFVGIIGALPIGLAVMVIIAGSPGTWSEVEWAAAFTWSVLMGGFVGATHFYSPPPLRADEVLPPTRLRRVNPQASDEPEA
jgi:hypothetical protein